MEFEFDPAKSARNLAKHGIDFVGAQALWLDEQRVEAEARVTGERRLLTVARCDGRYWTAIFTYRDDRVRIISVRRARKEEVSLYEG